MFIHLSLKKCIWCLFHTVTPAHHPLCERQWSKFRHHPQSELYINSCGDREKCLPGSSKRQRREDNPQCTIMSHGLACYSKGAELASRSEADVHLFWHFLSTLTQKTHDNTWLSAFLKYRLFAIPKTTFHTVQRGRKPWRSPVDVRRDRQEASHVVTVNNREKESYKGRHTRIWHKVIFGENQRKVGSFHRIANHQYLPLNPKGRKHNLKMSNQAIEERLLQFNPFPSSHSHPFFWSSY